MNHARLVVGVGALLGAFGAVGQLWLLQFGAVASAPLRTLLSMSVAVLIGVVAGAGTRSRGVAAAALMGLVAGAILAVVNLGSLLMNPALLGLDPFASPESFLIFVSSIIAGTVISSWLMAGVAAVVAWPINLAHAAGED